MPAYALTIFSGAFLLFHVQPLIGKYILPWFGGGPGVWTTCMLFFQLLLLGGYAYAHFSSRWFRPRAQAIAQLALVAGALALLPITPGDAWKPHGSGNPTLQILVLLGVCLGLPYFVLSTTGPLMQHWFARANPGRSPYRLYALSNAGSLLALVSYPFFFETHFTRKAQARLWACGLVVYAVCCGVCAVRLWKSEAGTKSGGAGGKPRASPAAGAGPSLLDRLLWVLLPACASVLLLATTNKLCQDVAVVPFLWVLPLALYLLSFIICFDSPRWYVRFPFALALIAALGGIYWALRDGSDWPLWKQVATYSGGLFICCMVCHGELYRLRPEPRGLTGFYLMIATGGALGGVFVAVGAPLLFTDYYELHWGLLLCGLLFVLVCATEAQRPETVQSCGGTAAEPLKVPGSGFETQGSVPEGPGCLALPTRRSLFASQSTWLWLSCVLTLLAFGGLDWWIRSLAGRYPAVHKGWFLGLRIGMWAALVLLATSWVVRKKHRRFPYWRLLACTWLSLGLAGLGVALRQQARGSRAEAVSMSRNFYGVLTVFEHRRNEPEGHHFLLQHGRITHGLQFVDPEMAKWPTSYYGPESGIGLGLAALPAGGRRIGVVGLGTGSVTVYGRRGDVFRIYEINPQVEQLAMSRFTYLSNCLGKVEVVPGDARLSLEREPPQHYDLLVLDAFSSDAIPVHLLTKEAFGVYERHLKTNGVIAVHISNHYLDLEPVVANLARQFGYRRAAIDYDEEGHEEEWWMYASTWVLLSRNAPLMDSAPIRNSARAVDPAANKVPLWTDDFASLFQILK